MGAFPPQFQWRRSRIYLFNTILINLVICSKSCVVRNDLISNMLVMDSLIESTKQSNCCRNQLLCTLAVVVKYVFLYFFFFNTHFIMLLRNQCGSVFNVDTYMHKVFHYAGRWFSSRNGAWSREFEYKWNVQALKVTAFTTNYVCRLLSDLLTYCGNNHLKTQTSSFLFMIELCAQHMTIYYGCDRETWQ